MKIAYSWSSTAMSAAGTCQAVAWKLGETFRDALRRELAEEGRIELTGEPDLHGLFFNSHISRRDHVAVYLVRHFKQDRLPEPNHEIVACGFFEMAALPAETTRGTRCEYRKWSRVMSQLQPGARDHAWRAATFLRLSVVAATAERQIEAGANSLVCNGLMMVEAAPKPRRPLLEKRRVLAVMRLRSVRDISNGIGAVLATRHQ